MQDDANATNRRRWKPHTDLKMWLIFSRTDQCLSFHLEVIKYRIAFYFFPGQIWLKASSNRLTKAISSKLLRLRIKAVCHWRFNWLVHITTCGVWNIVITKWCIQTVPRPSHTVRITGVWSTGRQCLAFQLFELIIIPCKFFSWWSKR